MVTNKSLLLDDCIINSLLVHFLKGTKKGVKSDSLIFVGNHDLETISSLFASNCPVFMPTEYSDVVNLRLDSNIVFYQGGPSQYKLSDIFAVSDVTH